jgi:hypothetical protein
VAEWAGPVVAVIATLETPDTRGKGHRNRVTSSTELEMVFITLPESVDS